MIPLSPKPKSGYEVPKDLRIRVEELGSELKVIADEGTKVLSGSVVRRLLRHEDIGDCIIMLAQRINDALNKFLVNGTIELNSLHHTSESIEKPHRKFEDFPNKPSRRHRDGTPDTLPYVLAGYKDQQKPISSCLDGTRDGLLEMIDNWVCDPSQPPVFWLSGIAGTGKSTIANTLAEALDEAGHLGASFIFSRDVEGLNTDCFVITTIAYQLANYDAGIRLEITKALQANRDIAELNIPNQYQKLLLEPLQRTVTSRRLIVIVMDAIDECAGSPDVIVSLFGSPSVRSLPFTLKLLVTGRPEVNLPSSFASPTLQNQIQSFHLQDIEESIIRKDIGLFLDFHFAELVHEHPHLQGWPAKEDVQTLEDRAGDSFLFAATSIKFINELKQDPKKRLRLVISGSTFPGRIDSLYTEILKFIFPGGSDGQLLSGFRDVFGAVVCLREPLPMEGLVNLLGIGRSSAWSIFNNLPSVVAVPEADNGCVRLVHPSFSEYLTTHADPRFFIDTQIHQTRLAYLTLTCMSNLLKRNICNLDDPSKLNEEIPNLSELLSHHIPSHLRYSCFHWASHIVLADKHNSDLHKLLHSFCTTKLLAWVEVMSLYGRIEKIVSSLKLVRKWFTVDRAAESTAAVLENAERFVNQFLKPISASAGHIYASALPFAPDCILYELYNHEVMNSARCVTRHHFTWNPCLSILSHPRAVHSIAFSPDGTRLVSGYDLSLRIWNSTTGAVLVTLDGHSGVIKSVAFSPDGTKVTSGGYDFSVRIWDWTTGAVLAILKGHTGVVYSVAFSPDGAKVASGSGDQSVRIWNSTIGTALATFKGHSAHVYSVAFSPDGSKIISGSLDQTIRIWDSTAGTTLATLNGHSGSVDSVSFSLDGTKIVSGGHDRSVRIWDSATGTILATLNGHSGHIYSVAFSPDGTKLASGGFDRLVRVWDSITGAALATFNGHWGHVFSVLFSPDGTKVVSGSLDNTIRIWDLTINPAPTTRDGHSDTVISASFSPDGARVVSGSFDQTVRIWDSRTGAALATLKGHLGQVYSVAFSPDGTKIVSGGDDQYVRIWDSTTVAPLAAFNHQRNSIKSVSFIQDGRSVVFEDADGLVYSWNWNTGVFLPQLGNNPFSQSGDHGDDTISIRDGWIFANGRNKRLCLLPDLFRHKFVVCSSHAKVAMFDISYNFHVLDLSKAL